MSRPRITLGITILACCSLILCAVAADPKKPTSQKTIPAKGSQSPVQQTEPTPVDVLAHADEAEPVAEEDRGPWEVTHKVELVFKDKLAAAGEKTLAAKVQLKNTSETEIPGKLVLVIDGSSIEGTKLHAPQGQFTETTPYLQMLPAKRVLDVGDETPVKTLILTSAEPTKDMNLEAASLRWRAFTLTKPADLDNSPPEDKVQVPGKGYTWGEMRRVMAIQNSATMGLVEKHNGAILGTGTSEDANGALVIRVYAAQGGMSRRLPGSIDGVPVELTVTGTIKGGPALSRVTLNDGKAEVPADTEPSPMPTPEPVPEPGTVFDPAADTALPNSASTASSLVASPFAAPQIGPPTRRFTRPVPIGVSAINQNDVCASGTLGCRCIDRNGNAYILSNNHVLAMQNGGIVGNPICQPSRGDVGCAANAGDVIATLTDFQPIQYFRTVAAASTAAINIMDAASALSPAGQVDVCTPSDGYGIPARTPQENLIVGMGVQKYGRTTGFTKGKIYSLNVEAIVRYTPGFARFRNTIDIQTQFRSPGFGAPGDSGSLVVTLADKRPVGILFAGGGYDTFLNPISPVLHRLKMGVDDGTGAPPILGSGRMGSASGPVRQHQNILLP